MSASVAFDTHFFVKRLQEKGFPEPQAETLVSVMREMQDATFQETVRPQALEDKASRKEMDSQFAELRKDIAVLNVKISDIKSDMLKWMITPFIGQYGLMIGLIVTLLLKR